MVKGMSPLKSTLIFARYLIPDFCRKIIIEKHWRSIISRQIVDVFSDESAKFLASGPINHATSNSEKNTKEVSFTKEDVPPILETSKYLLLHVLRDGLVWLCPVDKEG